VGIGQDKVKMGGNAKSDLNFENYEASMVIKEHEN